MAATRNNGQGREARVNPSAAAAAARLAANYAARSTLFEPEDTPPKPKRNSEYFRYIKQSLAEERRRLHTKTLDQ